MQNKFTEDNQIVGYVNKRNYLFEEQHKDTDVSILQRNLSGKCQGQKSVFRKHFIAT